MIQRKAVEKRTGFLDNLKTLLVEWSLLSTFHCYPKIFQTKNIYAKLTWSLLFIIFSCLTFWLVVKGIVDYAEFDVVSKIRVISQQSITFPTVTICDANPFASKEADELIREILSEENFTISTLYTTYNNLKINKQTERLELNTISDMAMLRVAYLSDSQKKSLGFSLNQIKVCEFDSGECELNWLFSYKLGNCFQFNSGKSANLSLKETTLGGRSYGLYLSLGPLINQNSFNTYYSTGLRIYIHNGSFLSSGAEEIFVKIGEQSIIKLKKTFTRKSLYPHSMCQDLTEFWSPTFELMKDLSGEYRQKDCLEICLQKLIVDTCGCMLTILPTFGMHLPCANANQKSCPSYIYEQRKVHVQEKCLAECPLECEYTKYDWSMSTLDYPNHAFFNSVRRNSEFYSNYTFEEYKNSHAMLNIFFDNVEYTEIVESPKTSFTDLIANLGGALGIFLGFSIFSLVELLEIVVRVVCLSLRKK